MKTSRFSAIVGTGGVGTGLVFRTDSNRILGRDESRLACLTDTKDYCKLHIVFHYLGKMLSDQAHIVALSMVGDDPAGHACVEMMERVGVDTSWMGTVAAPTMQSMCLIYPDHAGCNVTSNNSACEQVKPAYIQSAFADIAADAKGGLAVVALPEVPFESRKALLEAGRKAGAFCVTTVPSADARQFLREDGFSLCDLLAVNIDEAAALCGMEEIQTVEAGFSCMEMLARKAAHAKIWMTLGSMGSLAAEDGRMQWQQALPIPAVGSTAGAGDAGLAGILCGLAFGLPFSKPVADARWAETPLGSAVELGVLFSGLSIESPDSIAAQIDRAYVHDRVRAEAWGMTPLFEEIVTGG